MFEQQFGSLADYHATINGYIETVHLGEHPMVIVADEDGPAKQLPVNRRATFLWWLLDPRNLGREKLVGDVILVGPTEREEFSDVPGTLVALLLHSTQYQIQVLLSQESDTWVPIGNPVKHFLEAAIRALRLMEVWIPPTDVRVVPV
jgi:hypothetical protein